MPSNRLPTSAKDSAISSDASPTAATSHGLQAPALRGERRRQREHRAADDLVDADGREIPASQLAAQLASGTPAASWGGTGRLYHEHIAMEDTDIIVKPRDVMPEGRATLPRALLHRAAALRTRARRAVRTNVVLRGRVEEVERPGQFVLRELAGRQHHHHAQLHRTGARVPQRLPPSRHAAVHGDRPDAFAGSIQCPYHAWTYDLDGRLIGAPHMDEVPHFRKEDYPLHAVHADEWDGHIFLNLSRSPRRFAISWRPAVEVPPWRMQDLRLGHRIVYDVKANWKLIIQNYNECLHCPNLHPALNKLSHYLSGENEPLHATYMGGRMDLRPGVETLSMDGIVPARAAAGLSPDDRRRVYYYAIFPNMLLSLHPDYMMVHTLWPHRARTGRSTSASGTSSRRSWRDPASTPPTRSSSGT